MAVSDMTLKEVTGLPEFMAAVCRLDEVRLKSIRIGNANATLLLVRVVLPGTKSFVLRMEVRDVDMLLRGVPRDTLAWRDASLYLQTFIPEWSRMSWRLEGSPHLLSSSERFEAVLQASRGLSGVMDAVKKFVDDGNTDRAHAAHRMALALKEVKKAIGKAFAEGAVRGHVEEIMDELLVAEVMES